jgi:hypothetical protein
VAISAADRKRLRDGAGGECSFRDCRVRENLEESHIVADKPEGPRGDASFTKAQLDAHDNRTLLCPNHHSIVDGNPSEWTVEKLRMMKAEHEQDIARRLAGVATELEVGEDFWLEPGAPTFRVDPGVEGATAETVRLLMTFDQTSGDEVIPDIEWSGANVVPSRPLMMAQNQRPGARYQKYQLKPALARPSLPRAEVTFDIRFRWQDATRQYRWSWPMYMREKGIWGMNNIAENTLKPKDRTTLD